MKLYSGTLSLFSTKVRIALAEKNLDYQLESVAWSPARGYEPKHPFVLANNPKAQVPVLEHDGLVLYDSTLILEYLEDLAPDPPLFPRGPAAKARCRLLELEADEVAFAPIWTLIGQRVYATARSTVLGGERAAAAEQQVRLNYERLAAQLGPHEYLCGEFSVADISHALVASFAFGLGVPIPKHLTSLQAWRKRLMCRPSFEVELERMTSALAASQTSSELNENVTSMAST